MLNKYCFQIFCVFASLSSMSKQGVGIKKIEKRCYRGFALKLVKQTGMFFNGDQSSDAEQNGIMNRQYRQIDHQSDQESLKLQMSEKVQRVCILELYVKRNLYILNIIFYFVSFVYTCFNFHFSKKVMHWLAHMSNSFILSKQ